MAVTDHFLKKKFHRTAKKCGVSATNGKFRSLAQNSMARGKLWALIMRKSKWGNRKTQVHMEMHVNTVVKKHDD